MRAAIMQPYFFPYIGYFQLMAAVDVFVFLDDVQYINRGWVNRNRICIDSQARWLTLPVIKAAREAAINQRRYLLNTLSINRVLAMVDAACRSLPAYREFRPKIDRLINFADDNVAAYNIHHLVKLARALGVRCEFATSSALDPGRSARGAARLIELCRRVGATKYINAIGGTGLYDPAEFSAYGLHLLFLRTRAVPVAVSGGACHLSIIDGLMRNSLRGCQGCLPRYELLEHAAAKADAEGRPT